MKKRQVPEVNPYEELDLSEKELEETLPIDSPEKGSEAVQEERKEVKKDYLDEFAPSPATQNRNFSQPTMFTGEEKDANLIQNLLRVDWERVEHIVRGHKPKVDKEGNEYFEKIEGHYLNEKGVNSILHFLSFYLSKEIYLARYSYEQTQIIMKNFAKQFTDWFFDNVVEFGMDTPEKKKMSKMFVHAVIDLVDSAYSKAVEGKTSELVFKQFQVLQNQPLESYNNPYQNPQKPRAGIMQRIFG